MNSGKSIQIAVVASVTKTVAVQKCNIGTKIIIEYLESREAERESSWITHVSLLLIILPENNQNSWLYHGILMALIHKYQSTRNKDDYVEPK